MVNKLPPFSGPVDASGEPQIDDGNIYIFCDTVRTGGSESLACIRGAGHNGDHLFSRLVPLMPVKFAAAAAGPSPPAQDEEVVVAMLAACEATLRHLWDIAGRFENKESNAIRDEIDRLNRVTLPSIKDLESRLKPAAAVPSPPAQPPRLTDLQRICHLNVVQAMAVQQYIERWIAAIPPSSPVADSPMSHVRGSVPAEESDAEFENAIAEIREPVADSPTWLPIESAPERRKVMVTWVNALGKRRTTFAAFWPIGTLDMGDDTSEDHVDEDGKNVFAGWYEESEANDDDYWRLTEMLTHWMPLPSAPSASAGAPKE